MKKFLSANEAVAHAAAQAGCVVAGCKQCGQVYKFGTIRRVR